MRPAFAALIDLSFRTRPLSILIAAFCRSLAGSAPKHKLHQLRNDSGKVAVINSAYPSTGVKPLTSGTGLILSYDFVL
jgi:hypothetical protein